MVRNSDIGWVRGWAGPAVIGGAPGRADRPRSGGRGWFRWRSVLAGMGRAAFVDRFPAGGRWGRVGRLRHGDWRSLRRGPPSSVRSAGLPLTAGGCHTEPDSPQGGQPCVQDQSSWPFHVLTQPQMAKNCDHDRRSGRPSAGPPGSARSPPARVGHRSVRGPANRPKRSSRPARVGHRPVGRSVRGLPVPRKRP